MESFLEYREAIRDFLNGTDSEEELMNHAELVKCCTCGEIMLEEDAHSYECDIDNCKYCDTCWEAR